MKLNLKIPIRYKFLLTLLLVTTFAVSVITFTMANLFHSDKAGYIHDLTSVNAVRTAEEARVLMNGYRERLRVFGRMMLERRLPQQVKAQTLEGLFVEFPELVSVTLYADEKEEATLYDARALADAGVGANDLARVRAAQPLPFGRLREHGVFVSNTTLSERLPVFLLAIEYQDRDAERPVALAALVRSDALLNMARRVSAFETFLLDGDNRLLAHADAKLVADRETLDWIPNLAQSREQRSFGSTFEYAHAGTEWVGGVAPLNLAGVVAAVQIPRSAAFLTARELLNTLLGVALGLLLLAATIGLISAYRISRPLEQLSQATRVVGQGQFDINVQVSSSDEIGTLAQSFNDMAVGLKDRDEKLRQANLALVQSEKMSAFGQLSAGIAHEVKNPLTGILGYAQLTKRKFNPDDPLYKNLEVIEKETKRCRSIIDNLMRFARAEHSEKQPTDVAQTIRDAVAIVDHQLGIKQVAIELDVPPDLPRVNANANQLQQVVMNLMINAQQALEGKPGRVRVAVRADIPGRLSIEVSDDGPGIAPEIQSRIFEPFFSTKAAGEGTGLGLSVSYGIIKDHDGDISVKSAPGQGSTFLITLPAIDIEKKAAKNA
jgi:signal transduction histidine kinase